MPAQALEQALAAEATARTSKDDAAAAFRQREADLAAAEAAQLKATAAVQQAAQELKAREDLWRSARDAAQHTAHPEEHHAAHDHHGGHHGHHGHGHDDIYHGAQHQLQHRWIEKTAFGLGERAVNNMTTNLTERALERGSERVLEGIGERVVEAAGERLVEAGSIRLAERSAEVAIEKAGIGAARHMTTRIFGEALRFGESAAIRALKMLRVIVPFVGMLFVFHLAEHDIGRTREEWKKRSWISMVFALAVLGDLIDIWAHTVVVYSGVFDIDHHFLHEVEAYGMKAAVVACLSVMTGEVLSARAARNANRKAAQVTVVPVQGDETLMGA